MIYSKIQSETISNLNHSKIPVKVRFYTQDDKLLFQCDYPFNISMKDILRDFISKNEDKISSNSLNKNKLSFFLKNSQIYEKLEEVDQKLIDFYLTKIENSTLMIMEAGEKNSSNSSFIIKIYVQNEKRFTHISENMDKYIMENTYLIGKPLINELKYYIFNKKTNESLIIKCNKEDYNKIKIKYFSRMSVYCNAKNIMYIYECTDNSEMKYNIFFEINLITHTINIISTKFPKRILHSMIFIPECYIFIVGGKNSNKVLVYKIRPNNDKYEEYPHLLPFPILEPSLITINNKYLYAFENSSIRFNILRTDIISVTPFEHIKIDDSMSINQKFFGLVKFENKNSILFLGGQILNLPSMKIKTKNCFEFDYKSNKISLSEREYQYFDFTEKTFIPIEKGLLMQIAELKDDDNQYIQKVIFFYTEIENLEKEAKLSKNLRFNAISSKTLKITASPNVISLVGSESYNEIVIPLYNNK